MSKTPKRDLRIVKDWEEQLSSFLQEAIEGGPEKEPEVCERLIEYVQFLVSEGRVPLTDKYQGLIDELTAPRVLGGWFPANGGGTR